MFNLHGNPRDYAWGEGGLDAIITQVGSFDTASSLMFCVNTIGNLSVFAKTPEKAKIVLRNCHVELTLQWSIILEAKSA